MSASHRRGMAWRLRLALGISAVGLAALTVATATTGARPDLLALAWLAVTVGLLGWAVAGGAGRRGPGSPDGGD